MYAMLSLDLDKTTSHERRELFYEELKNRKWTKVPKVTTTWYASWEGGADKRHIENEIREDVEAAKKKARINSVDAVVMIGDNAPISF